MFGQFGDRSYKWDNGLLLLFFAFVFKNNFAGSRLENDVHVRVPFAPKLCDYADTGFQLDLLVQENIFVTGSI